MESEANDQRLTSAASEIVVNEPSPLDLDRSDISQITKQDNQLTQSSSTESKSSEESEKHDPESSAVVKDSTPEETESESSGAFNPVPDCAQCIVSEDQNTGELEIETYAETYAEQSEDNLSTSPNCGDVCTRICDFYYKYSNFLLKSKYQLPFQFVLLVFPISAGFMAARYMDECRVSTETPYLMFMMGILGTIAILIRMYQILRKIMLPRYREIGITRLAIRACNLFLILLLFTEMLSVFRMSPSFLPRSPNYCNPIFYQFAYWMNWATILLVIVLLILYAPTCNLDSVNFGYEVIS